MYCLASWQNHEQWCSRRHGLVEPSSWSFFSFICLIQGAEGYMMLGKDTAVLRNTCSLQFTRFFYTIQSFFTKSTWYSILPGHIATWHDTFCRCGHHMAWITFRQVLGSCHKCSPMGVNPKQEHTHAHCQPHGSELLFIRSTFTSWHSRDASRTEELRVHHCQASQTVTTVQLEDQSTCSTVVLFGQFIGIEIIGMLLESMLHNARE